MALRRVRYFGLLLLAAQFIGLCWWNAVMAGRFAMAFDFSTFNQAMTLISHGTLDPHSTTLGWAGAVHPGGVGSFDAQLYFRQDHSAFIIWPLSFIYRLWPHPETLYWIQNAATVGAEFIGFSWICNVCAQRHAHTQRTVLSVSLIATGAVLLAANPWFVWASSFDIHDEAFGAFAAIGTAYALAYNRRAVWIWLALGLACGDVGASYEAAVGVSAAISGRCWLRRGLIVAASGAVWVLALGRVHGSEGTRVGVTYPNLIGAETLRKTLNPQSSLVFTSVLKHPSRALSTLWDNRLAIWANTSPMGLFGWLWPPVLIPSAAVLLEAELSNSHDFYVPGFQLVALYTFAAVGMIGLLSSFAARDTRRRRLVVFAVLAVLAANAVGWAATWLPHASERWLRITPSAAKTLNRIERRIRPNDEVIVSQGVAGAFAGRASVYPITFGAGIHAPVQEKRIWVILAPAQGIESAAVSSIYADIASLSSNPHVRRVAAANGVWAFVWDAPQGAKWFTVSPSGKAPVPGWAVVGSAGKPVTIGPSADWYASSNGRAGYVVKGAYWREKPGDYQAWVQLASSGTANVELWNSTTGKLLRRVSVAATDGIATVHLSARLTRTPSERVFSGWGPWRQTSNPPQGDQLELRVWTAGGNTQVSVYKADIKPSAGAKH